MKQNLLHTRVQSLETMAVLAAFFLILSIVTGRESFVWPALVLLATGLFLKPLAAKVTRGWLKVSEIIGAVANRIILTLLFVAVLTPIALLFRIFTRNPLNIRRNHRTVSYFQERNHTFTAEDLEKMG
ncbi:MAG: SxtJ family membrane protein [Geobacteraceae bacterium]|nr:SxtJ family membrane protein [Geobacteraceae bacterium]